MRFLTVLAISALLSACVSVSPNADEAPSSIYRSVSGSGDQSVLFINGNGSSSSDWSQVLELLPEETYSALIYDRPGLGQSPLWEGYYSIDVEEDALVRVLREEEFIEDLIIVAHSYGGLIAALVQDDVTLKGVVLVDALIPGELTLDSIEDTFSIYRPQYEAVRSQAPDLAAAVIPVVEAFPETARQTESLTFPMDLKIIDIRAERPAQAAPQITTASAAHHQMFVEASSERQHILAAGSSHNIPRDRPDIIAQAIDSLSEPTD